MRLPIVKIVYNPVKTLLGTFANPPDARTWKTVLVEYPRPGVWMVAFVAGELPGCRGNVLSVFVPNTPNPAAGRAIIVPSNQVRHIAIPIDDALEFVVSGGTAIAESFKLLDQVDLTPSSGIPAPGGKTILPGIEDSSEGEA